MMIAIGFWGLVLGVSLTIIVRDVWRDHRAQQRINTYLDTETKLAMLEQAWKLPARR